MSAISKVLVRLFLGMMLFSVLCIQASSKEKATASSNDIFLEFMSEPQVALMFQKLQWAYLNESTEFDLLAYFTSEPELSPIFEGIRKSLNGELANFSASAKVSMLKLGPGLTEEYFLIDNLVKELALDMGFTQKAIENREVYLAPGGVNAFTVSGNPDRIIVVLQDSLVEKMELSEIKAVLAHELGHIRSVHTSSRVMHGLLLSLLAEHLGISLLEPEAQLNDEDFLFACQLQKKIKGVSSFKLTPASMFYQAKMHLESLQPERQHQLLANYLQLLLQNIYEMGVSKETLTYFSELHQLIGHETTLLLDPEQFDKHAAVAMMAVSRSNEKSSDRYATAAVPNSYAASAFVKLVGAKFDPSNRQGFFDSILESVNDFYETTPKEHQYRFLGGTHPSINLRVADIVNESPYPALLFGNPFLRLMFLEHGLRVKVANMEIPNGELPFDRLELQETQKRLQERILLSISALGWSSPSNPRFENAYQYIAYYRESLMRQLKEMEAKISSMENDEQKERAKQGILIIQQNIDVEDEMAVALLKSVTRAKKATKKRTNAYKVLVQREKQLKNLVSAKDPEKLLRLREEVTHKSIKEKRTVSRRLPTKADQYDCNKLLRVSPAN